MLTKAKILCFSFLIIAPIYDLYSQNRIPDINFHNPDSIHSKISLSDKSLLKSNLILKLNDLELIKGNEFIDSLSYSKFYKDLYGITPDEKNKIDKNLVIALQNSLHTEDPAIITIRQYLGISKDIFAIILAIIHLAKYY
jgi:hypothetical protein